MPRNDPYRQFRYKVEIKGITQGGFSECSFAAVTVDPVDYREGTDPTYQRKLSGLTKYGTITLKWGITDSMELYDWYKQVVDKGAQANRKNISIILMDEQGDEKSRWNLTDCWPTKYDPPDFNAKTNDVAVELLELVAEHYERLK